MKNIILIYLMFVSVNLSAAALDLSDISIIMPPTPDSLTSELMIKSSDIGPRGAVIPKYLYDQMESPEIISPLHEDGDISLTNEEFYNQYFKVVSIRIDPCFVFEAGPFKCERQIRYVFQPVVNTETTLDIAVHSFYNLTDSEFKLLIQNLTDLKSKYQQADKKQGLNSLQNPVLYLQGLNGPYWKELKNILLSYTGEDNFVRLNTIANAMDRVWVFRSFKFVDGKLVDNIIPFVKTEPGENFSIQMFRKRSFDNTYLSILFTPYDEGTESAKVTQIFLDEKVAKTYSEEDLKSIFTTVVKDQNPLLTDTTTVDCLRCHVATMLDKWGKLNVNKNWNWLTDFPTYPAPTDIKALPENFDATATRMFGYWKKSELISQRVINESVESLKIINETYLHNE